MRLVINDVGAAHLDEVRRFRSPAEAEASLQLRAREVAGLAEYDRRARIVGGTAEERRPPTAPGWPTSPQACGARKRAAHLGVR